MIGCTRHRSTSGNAKRWINLNTVFERGGGEGDSWVSLGAVAAKPAQKATLDIDTGLT